MWYKDSVRFWAILTIQEMNCVFPGDKGEREPIIDQGTWSMCSWFSMKSFGSSDLQFSCNPWYPVGRNWCSDVQNEYKAILERFHTIWINSGSIGNFKIILILAGLMIVLTSLFHANPYKTNNIQSDHHHIVCPWAPTKPVYMGLIFSFIELSMQEFDLLFRGF